MLLVGGVYGALAGGPRAQPQLGAKVGVDRVLQAQDPRGLVAQALGQRQVEELFAQAFVATMPPADEKEDNHGEKVEHEEEAGADADGQVLAFGQSVAAAPTLIRPGLPDFTCKIMHIVTYARG